MRACKQIASEIIGKHFTIVSVFQLPLMLWRFPNRVIISYSAFSLEDSNANELAYINLWLFLYLVTWKFENIGPLFWLMPSRRYAANTNDQMKASDML